MPTEHDKPLIQKLGYQQGEAVDTLDAPEWFLEYLRGNGVHTHAKLPAEWMHLFMHDRARLAGFLEHLKFNEIQKGFWVSWPKGGSGIQTDITEQTLRDLVLPYGWVDVKVCSIDTQWSGLKFVKRTHQ